MKGKNKHTPISDQDKMNIAWYIFVIWLVLSPLSTWVLDATESCPTEKPNCDSPFILIWLLVVLVAPLFVFAIGAVGYMLSTVVKESELNLGEGRRALAHIVIMYWRQFRAINNDELFEDES